MRRWRGFYPFYLVVFERARAARLDKMVLKFVQGRLGRGDRRKGERAEAAGEKNVEEEERGGGKRLEDLHASTTTTTTTFEGTGENADEGVMRFTRPKQRFRLAPSWFQKPPQRKQRVVDDTGGVHFVKSDQDLQHLIEETKNGSSKLFVEFGAAWCEHCKGMIPTMIDLSRKNKKHTFAVADVFATPEISKSVVYTPTFWVFDDGVKVDQLVGSNPMQLRDRIWLHTETK